MLDSIKDNAGSIAIVVVGVLVALFIAWGAPQVYEAIKKEVA